MRFWTEISARLAGLSGSASPEEARQALNEFDVRDIQAVRVSEGGGGNGGSQPGAARFIDLGTVEVGDVNDGSTVTPVLLYTPAAGEEVLAVFISAYVGTDRNAWLAVGRLGIGRNMAAVNRAGSGTEVVDTPGRSVISGIPWLMTGDPIYASLAYDGLSLFSSLIEPWAASTSYVADVDKVALLEAGAMWGNDGADGVSGLVKPDFAGNVGGSVADGPDINWTDQQVGATPLTAGSITTRALVTIPAAP